MIFAIVPWAQVIGGPDAESYAWQLDWYFPELAALESVVASTSSGLFGGLIFLVNLPLAVLVPSTSGHAALAMPILAPLADFAGVSRAMVVTAFQSASGIVNLITPTSAVVMGGLALAKVR